jgi:hypothetical protein
MLSSLSKIGRLARLVPVRMMNQLGDQPHKYRAHIRPKAHEDERVLLQGQVSTSIYRDAYFHQDWRSGVGTDTLKQFVQNP